MWGVHEAAPSVRPSACHLPLKGKEKLRHPSFPIPIQPRIHFGHIDYIRILNQQIRQIREVIALMLVGDAFDGDDGAEAVGEAVDGGGADAGTSPQVWAGQSTCRVA